MIALISVVENSRNKPSAIGSSLQKFPTTQGTKKPGGLARALLNYQLETVKRVDYGSFRGRPLGRLPSPGGLLALRLAASVLASDDAWPISEPGLIGLLQCGQLWVVVIGSWFVSFYSHLFQQQILLVLFVSLGIA
jgi:hypothetical protein